ncbi:leucine-rich repeat-containing protein 31-like [Amphiura filiformis]|uniref:leucine-rich repeat-containing protein 31-like n=1 Tax=Amphiura filiformis TaxID=82378 RepID=UPI003B22862C
MLSEFLPLASNMQELDLSRNTIWIAIEPLLQQCTRIFKLRLSSSQLEEENMKLLIEFLPKASNLQELDLSHNSIGMAMEHLARQLQYCKISTLNLTDTELKESHFKILAKFLPKASSLRELNLSMNEVGMAIDPLAQQLQYCKIERLTLSDTKLKEDHIKILSEFLPKASNLHELNLSNNCVGMALVPLAHQLQCCTKVVHLNLYFTDIEDRGIIELSKSFISIPNLTVLNLGWNEIGNTGTDAVFRHINHLTKLEYLEMDVRLDMKCSALVKVCCAAVGKDIGWKRIRMDHKECQLIQGAASKYLYTVMFLV